MASLRSRRAAAALAWGAVWFSAILWGVEGGFRDLFARWEAPEYHERRRIALDRLAAPSSDAGKPLLAVMLGSSRTDNGFWGAAAEDRLRSLLERDVRVVNFGFSGALPGRSLVHFGRLLRDGPLPDLLLVEASFVHLTEAWFEANGPLHLGPLSDLDRAWLAEHGFPAPPSASTGPALWRRRADVLAALAPPLDLEGRSRPWSLGLRDPHGGGRFPLELATPEHRRAAFARITARYRAASERLQCGGPLFEALRAILSECRARGIPAAMVLMPEGPAFRSWYGPGVSEAARGKLFDLAAETGADVVDAWEWLDDDAFLDGHHLLPPFDEKFTARLSEEAAARWKRRISSASPAADGGRQALRQAHRPPGASEARLR